MSDEDLTTTTEFKREGPSELRRMMTQYYLEYASYVIKERAIPHVDDGLKPVQRRIMHTLWEADDGKFHKVANIVGSTMKYHPHGDTSIGDALVNLANKEYFIEKQGNFGNIITGDIAAASRYIESRLSPLSRETLFNREITEFVDSYDGRNQEPVTLPSKVPILLMQGTEGIAVGMSTRVLSHNFNELIDAEIACLRGKPFKLYPDFLQGASMDVSEYDDGNGKVRVRAIIEPEGDKKLIIREIPPSATTESLIASIEDAAQKGKIKIASITDYTAESVEIEIKLPRNVYADQTIQALYAYTRCEDSISVNCLVIKDNRPEIMTVTTVLEHNANKLMDDLRRELEIELGKLNDQFHAKTLAQIFIENRIYKRIEEAKTWDLVLSEVHDGLKPFRHLLRRDVTDEDVEKLLQIQIRRISLFDIEKNRRDIDEILLKIDAVQEKLADIRGTTITYLKELKKKYGPLYPRRTRIEAHEHVDIRKVALTNVKVSLDRSNGFVGTAVKGDNPLICTEYDRLVIVGWDGKYKVIPIPDKLYVGSVCEVYKADKEQIYSMIYRDKKSRVCYAKRFKIDRYIMEKEYAACPKGTKIEKLFDRYGIVVRCEFEPGKRTRVNHTDIDFEEIQVRGAQAKGYKVDSKKVVKFLQIKRGSETPPGQEGTPTTETDESDTGDAPEENLPQPKTDSPVSLDLNLASLQREADEKATRKKAVKKPSAKPKDKPSEASQEPPASDKPRSSRNLVDDGDFELES